CAGAGGAAAWALREIQAVETPRCQAASCAARGSRPVSETLLLPAIERNSAARIASVFQTWVRYTNPKTENSNQVELSICRGAACCAPTGNNQIVFVKFAPRSKPGALRPHSGAAIAAIGVDRKHHGAHAEKHGQPFKFRAEIQLGQLRDQRLLPTHENAHQ